MRRCFYAANCSNQSFKKHFRNFRNVSFYKRTNLYYEKWVW